MQGEEPSATKNKSRTVVTVTVKKKQNPAGSELVRKKPSSPEAQLVRKKPSSPEAELVRKKPSSPEAELVRKKPSSPETELVRKKPVIPEKEPIKKKIPVPETHSGKPAVTAEKKSTTTTPKKKKYRLKKNVKSTLLGLCVVGIFGGVVAVWASYRNTLKNEEAVAAAMEATAETEPEITEAPTTEEPTTEEPTTEPDENAAFIDPHYKIDISKPMVALTYDDGPLSGSTDEILDILERYHAHATFFVVGEMVTPETRKILQREVKLGCEVGNHTWSHQSLKDSSIEDALEEIKKCDDAVYKAIKRYPQHVRPPYGEYSEEIQKEEERSFIYWSLDTNDWKWLDSQKDYEVLMENVSDGDIILMHDIHPESALASERIIPDLLDEGYQLVTVSELMYYRNFEDKDDIVLFDVHPNGAYYQDAEGNYIDEDAEETIAEEEYVDDEEYTDDEEYVDDEEYINEEE